MVIALFSKGPIVKKLGYTGGERVYNDAEYSKHNKPF
jgi:hypothetical protein